MNNYFKCFEIFESVLADLATTDYPLRERLRRAIDDIYRVREHDVPQEMMSAYLHLIGTIESFVQDYREPQSQATVRQLSDEQCIQLASDIWRFNSELHERKNFNQ